MSLDFYLETEPREQTCDHCGSKVMRSETVFDINITHNLNRMADAAGIYDELWRPDLSGYMKARDIIETLKAGLSDLLNRPCHFQQFNSPNGWGTYEHFVPFVQEVLRACQDNPDAFIRVSR